jgi:hypothetical protein
MSTIPIVRAESLIPRGPYCYQPLSRPPVSEHHGFPPVRACPFWSVDARHRRGASNAGYCSYLKRGDWMQQGASLLRDQIKECGVKPEDDDHGLRAG